MPGAWCERYLDIETAVPLPFEYDSRVGQHIAHDIFEYVEFVGRGPQTAALPKFRQRVPQSQDEAFIRIAPSVNCAPWPAIRPARDLFHRQLSACGPNCDRGSLYPASSALSPPEFLAIVTCLSSRLVLAKGRATGFGGPNRQRIRATSLVASRFDRRRNPSRRGSLAPSPESLNVSNSAPRRSRPTV